MCKAGAARCHDRSSRSTGPAGHPGQRHRPSYIDTEQLRVDADDAGISLDEMRQRYRDLVPVRRLASPDDIAAAVSFLAGPAPVRSSGRCCSPAEA